MSIGSGIERFVGAPAWNNGSKATAVNQKGLAGYKGVTADSWSLVVALASLRRLESSVNAVEGVGQLVEIKELHILSPYSFSIVFEAQWIEGLVGLHLEAETMLSEEDYTSVEREGIPVGHSAPEQLAFDVAHLMIGEPFGEDCVSPPDEGGVRWLRLRTAD